MRIEFRLIVKSPYTQHYKLVGIFQGNGLPFPRRGEIVNVCGKPYVVFATSTAWDSDPPVAVGYVYLVKFGEWND